MDATYAILVELLPEIASWPAWAITLLTAGLPALACFTFMSLGPILYVYAERKISAFMQDRLGPMRVGWHGILQSIIDPIKLGLKEDLVPDNADKPLFFLAPFVILCSAFATFVVVPFSHQFVMADLSIGVLYVVSIGSAF